MNQGHVRLDGVTHFVLDEADRMLDMGFIHDVRRIVAAIPRQAPDAPLLGHHAARHRVAREQHARPTRCGSSVTPAITTAEKVDQSVVFVAARREARAARAHAPQRGRSQRAIVFTRTKHGANRLSEQLERSGIGPAAIHGNKSQSARERALEAFRSGTTRVLVATDIAARGIDVDGISHVINFDLPNVAESYVHRIGRTGRAGASGHAVSFCDPLDERTLLRDIERLIRQTLPVVDPDGAPAADPMPMPPARALAPARAAVLAVSAARACADM